MADSSDASSSEGTSPSPVKINQRPIRSKKLPAKLRQLQDEDEEIFTFEELELEQSSKCDFAKCCLR